jgi:fluoroquinolone transport system ATP-binding protein
MSLTRKLLLSSFFGFYLTQRGKSTLQKILLGMLPGYAGMAQVNGVECRRHKNDFYEHIGVDFEFSTMYEKLTARENLRFFSSLYAKDTRSADELLERVGLMNEADKRVSQYSKGMKARLNFIKALLHEPELICLDEPTSGLDPTNNRLMKDMILEEKKKGRTILLTTHNMQDAAELCDRVAFIVGGQIMAIDSPHNLIMSRGASKVTYSWIDQGEKSAVCAIDKISEDEWLQKLIRENRLLSIHSGEPTLNDIFMDITGRTLI